jgi:hypothetical protein
MNKLADEYTARRVGSYFIYTHEAHPGELYPHLTSMEQKHEHAEDLRDIYGVTRPILVDALDGACHRGFGSMPNMSWIFNSSGAPVYKSDWTDVLSVKSALEYFISVGERKTAGEKLGPFRTERLDYRNMDQEAFYNGLARNGPKAVQEFRDAF